MTDSSFEIVFENDVGTAGAVTTTEDAAEMSDYNATKVDVDYLESMVGVVRELGWETVWVAIHGPGMPLLIEAEEGHGKGTLAVAPIIPEGNDED